MLFNNISKTANKFLFRKISGNNIIYNQCWEDPEIDKLCLELKPVDTMLVLTSAGCNILDYCLEGVKRIHAVDINYRQNALLEFKMVMIEQCDYEIFFKFFGKGRIDKPEIIFHQSIRPHLPQTAQKYWDKNIKLFDSKRKHSFYHSTTSGNFARLANFISRRLLGLNKSINQLTEATSLKEQAAIYDTIEPHIFSPLLKSLWVFQCLSNLIGVPAQQLNLLNTQYPGKARQFVQDSLRYVMTQTHLKKDNYFWLVYLLGEYTPNCCPAYLKENNFNQLKKLNIRNIIQLHNSSVLDFLKTHTGEINKFVLLDHMDWLSHGKSRAILQEQWNVILKKSAPQARILFRSGGLNIDWMNDISVYHKEKKQPLFDCIQFNPELSQRLHMADRVHTYGSFYVADVL
jgi:S-adenosylmethionine-diacylglycerol 3-amino-3-carboxypropyl transferase